MIICDTDEIESYLAGVERLDEGVVVLLRCGRGRGRARLLRWPLLLLRWQQGGGDGGRRGPHRCRCPPMLMLLLPPLRRLRCLRGQRGGKAQRLLQPLRQGVVVEAAAAAAAAAAWTWWAHELPAAAVVAAAARHRLVRHSVPPVRMVCTSYGQWQQDTTSEGVRNNTRLLLPCGEAGPVIGRMRLDRNKQGKGGCMAGK